MRETMGKGDRESASRERLRYLLDEPARRILVLDGAMGTQIQSLGLTEADFRGERYAGHGFDLKGNYDVLCLSRPGVVAEIHRAYLAAGADIISTNTLNATRFGQAGYGTEGDIRAMNEAGARLAAAAAAEFTAKDLSRPRLVAGVLGPTGKTCSISSNPDDPGRREVGFDQMAAAYLEQVEGLVDGGVDILMLETVFDTLNAKAALFAIRNHLDEVGRDIPIWVSATVSWPGGRTLSGQTVEAFWTSVAHSRPFCVGLNCGMGAEALRPHLLALEKAADTLVSVHPNAGLPDELGRYNETPETMAASIRGLAAGGLVNIVGGCCGTTPEHIRAIAASVAGKAPRAVPELPLYCRLSGLEQLEIRPDSLFVNVGERTNISGSVKFARLIKGGRSEEALQVARDQIRAGAQIIDVNVDDPLFDSAAEMTKFLNLCASDPEIARVPVMVDSARWEVIEAGLKCLQGKGVVNSISLKDGEEEFIRRARLVRMYGAAVVVMAFDEDGQAEGYDRKVKICSRAYGILTERVGFPAQDVILDPGVFAVGTGVGGHDDYAVSFIEATRTLKSALPRCLVSGGVSNLSFGFRGNDMIREAMHSVFLYHAIRAGMDMGIVNAGQLGVYEEIPREIRDPIEDLILGRRPGALMAVLELARVPKDAAGGAAGGAAAREPDWRAGPVAERLQYAMVHGIADYIEEDTVAALEELGDPMKVIDGPLMSGMETVGNLFGAGKMFLPQVVRSARVMKKAVSVMKPHLEAGSAPWTKGKILLATVQGDVHDIGKNLVSVVLSCNNYNVLDLGCKVPAGEIVAAVEREKPDVIGLSGLITPSLEQMVRVAAELERKGIEVPLLVGGAATSRAHTALKIDPVYRGAVLYVRDASRAVGAVESLLGGGARSVHEVKSEHARVRSELSERGDGPGLLALEEARARKPTLEWARAVAAPPRQPGTTTIEDYPLADAIPFMDWTAFAREWKLSGRLKEEKERLLNDAKALLKHIEGEKLITARAVVGLFAANSVGDDIELYAGGDRSRPLGIAQCLRQQERKSGGAANLCLADFIAPKGSGIADYLGAFVVSAGFGCEELALRYEKDGDDYRCILVKALANHLAEACAEDLHGKVRRELWGYAAGEKLSAEESAAGKYAGIRPAPGYPACPDHTAKGLIFDLLDARGRIGVSLTDSYDIEPAASVAGWYFAHPESKYFKVGRIGHDQLIDYARRKGMSVAETQRWQAPNLR